MLVTSLLMTNVTKTVATNGSLFELNLEFYLIFNIFNINFIFFNQLLNINHDAFVVFNILFTQMFLICVWNFFLGFGFYIFLQLEKYRKLPKIVRFKRHYNENERPPKTIVCCEKSYAFEFRTPYYDSYGLSDHFYVSYVSSGSTDYIDVGDGSWGPNVLMASLWYWWPIQDVDDRLNTLRKSPT